MDVWREQRLGTITRSINNNEREGCKMEYEKKEYQIENKTTS